MKKQLLLYAIALVLFLTIGCSHQVALQRDSLQKNQTITAEMNDGNKVSGTVSAISDQSVTINTQGSASRTLDMNKISRISGPEPVYDAKKRIISEQEIAAVKTNKKFWTYTLSGGLVSAGASFFLSSMVAKSSGDDIEDPVIVSGTAAGTLVGGWLFSRWGKAQDRRIAIEDVRLSRAGTSLDGLEAEKEKQEKIQQQLDRVKQEREQQEAELQKLKDKLDKDKKE